MATEGHVFNQQARITTQVQDQFGTRTVDLEVHLEVDFDSLIRQLTAAALVSDSKPKQASRAQAAVRLVIIREEITHL